MPRKLEIDGLLAEEAGLRVLLTEAQRVNDPIGEMQYEDRLEEIKEQVQRLQLAQPPTASVALFFSGKPVQGSVGISSDFAGRILRGYQDLIAKAFVKAELGGMGERGPVPLKQNTTLMVTGVAHGSFGFVLDEISDQTEIHDTPLKEAVSSASALLEGVSAINERTFEEVSCELDARTLAALQKFLSDLDSEGATVRIVEDDRELALDASAIRRGRMRTEATEIEESPVQIEGVLEGFLPDHRRFELKGLDGHPYYGAVTKEAVEQFRSGEVALGKRCSAGITIRSVRSLNKPTRLAYRLMKFYPLNREAK
ncbi:hypothetical protein [Candidatus Nitrospira bockiana]